MKWRSGINKTKPNYKLHVILFLFFSSSSIRRRNIILHSFHLLFLSSVLCAGAIIARFPFTIAFHFICHFDAILNGNNMVWHGQYYNGNAFTTLRHITYNQTQQRWQTLEITTNQILMSHDISRNRRQIFVLEFAGREKNSHIQSNNGIAGTSARDMIVPMLVGQDFRYMVCKCVYAV